MSEHLQNQILDYLEGRMTELERESFEKTIAEDPELSREISDLQTLDHGLQAVGLEELMQDLKSWEQELELPRQPRINWKNFLAMAAVVTLIVVPAIYMFIGQKPTSEELFLAYYQPYEEMITSRGDTGDSVNVLLAQGMEAYSKGAYQQCSDLLQSYLEHHSDARVSLYLAIAQLELNQGQSAEANFLVAQQDPLFRQQAQWYQALSYLKFAEVEKAKNVLDLIAAQPGHYRSSQAGKLLKELS